MLPVSETSSEGSPADLIVSLRTRQNLRQRGHPGREADSLTQEETPDDSSRRILAAVALILAATAVISRASKHRRAPTVRAQSTLASRSRSSLETIPSA